MFLQSNETFFLILCCWTAAENLPLRSIKEQKTPAAV